LGYTVFGGIAKSAIPLLEAVSLFRRLTAFFLYYRLEWT